MTGLKEVKGQAIRPSKRNLSFDYATLSSSVAEFLKAQVHRIRRQAAISTIHIGKDLIAAKHYLSHGKFMNWVEAEVGIPARTAQAYMHVAEWASHKSATVALLPPSILYVLSASSTPQDYIDDILRRFESGERIALAAIREELRSLRKGCREEDSGQCPAAQRGAQLEHRISPVTVEMEVQVQISLRHAVSILACGLCTEDLARVREIFTSKAVRDDCELGTKLAVAFSSPRASSSCVYDMVSITAETPASA